MTKRLAELLEVQISQVNLKATTTEGLGSIGRQEGIAANAIVSIAFPIS
ncbi:MAG: 2-C-methyl-D-erythritol 2,4-cyclodiphosphate synthase [Pseudomonadota bacterium]|nr:2-C-methyl-D-erythritol 2,4-cyclodiphosphate synthase [Pseudomonadota bacterium]